MLVSISATFLSEVKFLVNSQVLIPSNCYYERQNLTSIVNKYRYFKEPHHKRNINRRELRKFCKFPEITTENLNDLRLGSEPYQL